MFAQTVAHSGSGSNHGSRRSDMHCMNKYSDTSSLDGGKQLCNSVRRSSIQWNPRSMGSIAILTISQGLEKRLLANSRVCSYGCGRRIGLSIHCFRCIRLMKFTTLDSWNEEVGRRFDQSLGGKVRSPRVVQLLRKRLYFRVRVLY